MNKDLKNKKLFLLDQDGTLYKGNVLFKATPLFLDEIKKRGGRYVLITNNTSTSDEDYIKKLDKLGIKVTKEEFFTAAQATVIYLNRYHKGAKVFLVGTESFRKYLVEEGINLVESKDAEVALLSYDRELTYQKLWDLSELLTLKDIPYIATNPDLVCPTTFGFVPDCGSFAHMIKNATGKTPHFIGKPSIEFFRLALLKMNATIEESVVIGDRLYTDILGALNSGITSVLVLSGETKLTDLEKVSYKPDYVFNDISEIL